MHTNVVGTPRDREMRLYLTSFFYKAFEKLQLCQSGKRLVDRKRHFTHEKQIFVFHEKNPSVTFFFFRQQTNSYFFIFQHYVDISNFTFPKNDPSLKNVHVECCCGGFEISGTHYYHKHTMMIYFKYKN